MPAHKAPWHPPAPMTDAQLARFLSHVELSPTGCWLWTGAVIKGRGTVMGHVRIGDRDYLAHRAAFLHFVGLIPIETPELDHLCRTPRCVNPTHLEPVTRAENQRRAEEAMTKCSAGHPYDPANRYHRKNRPGRGECRSCVLERERRKRRRLAA